MAPEPTGIPRTVIKPLNVYAPRQQEKRLIAYIEKFGGKKSGLYVQAMNEFLTARGI